MLWVLILGLLMNLIVLPLAALRVLFLYRAITLGQPAPDRVRGVTRRMGAAAKRQVVEVFGQKKLLKWSVPGAAHFFVFWAFLILATVYLEAYGSLVKLLFTGGEGPMDWAIPIVGHWPLLGFLQDFIAVMALFGLAAFVYIRLKNAPKTYGRGSRFFGSHLSGAWITLFMIFNVIWTMFLFRGASSALGNLPYESGAFVSIGVGNLLDGLSHGALEFLEGIGLLLHIGVMLAFLLFVLNSKHLHIFLAPLNVLFGREPRALGAAKPMMNDGKAADPRGPGGPRRGLQARRRRCRGLLLEGHPRLRDVHRVRSLPGPVPGVEHREAPVAQADDHGAARPHARQGAVPAGRRGQAGRDARGQREAGPRGGAPARRGHR